MIVATATLLPLVDPDGRRVARAWAVQSPRGRVVGRIRYLVSLRRWQVEVAVPKGWRSDAPFSRTRLEAVSRLRRRFRRWWHESTAKERG